MFVLSKLKVNRIFKRICCKHFSTVFAVSSGQGKCGIAVIRVTGKNAKDVFNRMCLQTPKPKYATLGYIWDPVNGEKLDKGLLFWFPGPHNYTGEDIVELHCHGGPAVIKAILSGLGKIPGFSPAKPGDFTKRAFYNNKLDLTNIEGLGNLIHAECEAQRKQALRQMDGSLSNVYKGWRDLIIQCIGTVDAHIDFGESDDIQASVVKSAEKNLEKLMQSMARYLEDPRGGERLHDGLRLTIIGKPNVGKSSFLNEVVETSAAIVSPREGTTRDIIQVPYILNNYPVNICDTAGLTTSEDPIESEGIERAISRVANTDIAIIMLDANVVLSASIEANISWDEFVQIQLKQFKIFDNDKPHEWYVTNSYIVIVNKIDILTPEDKQLLRNFVGQNGTCLSVKTKESFSSTVNQLGELCSNMFSSCIVAESSYVISSRHRTHIEACYKLLNQVLHPENEEGSLLSQEDQLVIASSLLFSATRQLGYVVGDITTEDILDHIFSNFCIGK